VVRRPEGVFVPFKRGEIGPDLFKAACNMGLGGMVSKRVDRPYRARQSGKNRPVRIVRSRARIVW
jgi:bifunctional non-homologous end joining protein LigD